jgi:hypothetical protein
VGHTLTSLKKTYAKSEAGDKITSLIAQWKKDCAIPISAAKVSKRVNKEASVLPTSEEQTPSIAPEKVSSIKVDPVRQPLPQRDEKTRELIFPDFPDFRPNMTPQEVLQAGSFGGTYFRSIRSSVTGITYNNKQWEEFPKEWFAGLDTKKMVCSQHYDKAVNKYGVECGGDLDMWESSGWIKDIDPYGWFQWYCRFYLGRRCSDDLRQVRRGLGVMGKKGRFRNQLINKILMADGKVQQALDNWAICPKIRQLLQHWGYEVTARDLKIAAALK